MLELSKYVLRKVSFDRTLFRKELIKATKRLGQSDRILLYAWCLATFGNQYREVIVEVFS